MAAPTPRIDVPKDKIAAFCRKWKIAELALFGSVLRDDFRPDSDVDVLATFVPQHGWSLFDIVHMEDELGALLARKVDFCTRNGVEQSSNPYRKAEILKSAATVYASA
ncbi:MAG: nucleotidyltransferase family protein [Rhodospirillales bacterium]